MGIDIHGWVEVTVLDDSDRLEPYAWSGVIQLGYLIGWYDAVGHALFGFRPAPRISGEPASLPPVAADRGLPQNPSTQVAADLQAIKDHEAKFGPGEFDGYTHISWEEIESIQWDKYGVDRIDESPWSTVFAMIRVLKSDERFATAGVRIVCWRSW